MDIIELIDQYVINHSKNPNKIVLGRQKYLDLIQSSNDLNKIVKFQNNDVIANMTYMGIPLEKNFNIEGMYVE